MYKAYHESNRRTRSAQNEIGLGLKERRKEGGSTAVAHNPLDIRSRHYLFCPPAALYTQAFTCNKTDTSEFN
ncbi:hypothetical protein OUZ56_002344 [Daphnia magna]|uniref:Uncharacterized protein n=1 Tax=Daphnia magna TaxID=35525 RepID=A0ABR0A5E0_9CRUS|nr:hypothetical protein OUZ56_002344 [Daphnia magna]